jgi:D-alanyl-lipoteichoic acid acyltransferase DltB (MBOAT superfamily)
MVFSAYPFLLIFLPLTLIGFYALRAAGWRRMSVSFLLLASLIFYGAWSRQHLALLLASIVANYCCGRYAASSAPEGRRRLAMIAAVIGNLSLIFWFKYLDFAGSNLAALTGADWTFRNILLPLGISFFTFQQIAYLVDCYKTRDGERSFRDYALFVTFFPQLIAGPIVHHRYTRPQFAALASGRLNADYVPYGVMIFAMGLAKKTLIADPIARAIDPLWAAAAAGDPVGAAAAWTAMIGYTLQIYFDFSGYCDMAIGLGLMVGVRLPVNFNSPYRAKSIIDFWRRWHMTLSAFLRDYVYIPLGGNKGGAIFRLRNIFLTMLIGGVWHGAAWTFVIWGAIHASLITLNHAARLWLPQLDRWRGPAADAVKRAALLAAVMTAWVYFRADGVPAAHAVLRGLFAPAASFAPDPYLLALMAFGACLALFAPNSLAVAGYVEALDGHFPGEGAQGSRILRPTPMAAAATAIMLAAGLAVAWRPAVFIYFNF